ncbi:MAG: hypothetical protein ACJA0X_002314 [Cyclobacteriaceae bacterium]|jgi:hypothetical protein
MKEPLFFGNDNSFDFDWRDKKLPVFLQAAGKKKYLS